jgi:hypothetical protein
MTDKDKNITDFFNNNPLFQVESTLISVNSAHTSFEDAIKKAPANLISKRRKEQAMAMVNAAKMVLLAYNTDAQIGRLDLKSQRRVLEMIDQVTQGKREAVQFQLSGDCENIRELFSNESFKITKK